MKFLSHRYSLLFAVTLLLASCGTVDLYEKTVPIPKHQWQSNFTPSFTFTITDSTKQYQPFLVLRHTERYNFNNIYVNLYIQPPGQDSAVKIQQDIQLADNERGWYGTGMDDIYEVRLPLGPSQLLKAGNYTFRLEQIMREDPLEHVLDAGIRIEKQ